MFVVSGGKQEELVRVFKGKGIDDMFADIRGSPVAKVTHAQDLTATHHLDPTRCLFVGDGWTDLKTAEAIGVPFLFVRKWSDWPDADVRIGEARVGRGVSVTECEGWDDVLALMYE